MRRRSRWESRLTAGGPAEPTDRIPGGGARFAAERELRHVAAGPPGIGCQA